MKLERRIGFWGVFCIAAGAMISSGLFVLPAIAVKNAGPAAVLAYALAGILVIPAMMSKAELATAMPKSGGSYFFIERSMGALSGVLGGLGGWFSIALKSAFALVGIGVLTQLLWGEGSDWAVKAVAIAFCVLFTTLNLLSVKGVKRVQIFMVAVLLAILGVFVLTGLPRTQHDHFAGFMDKGLGSVLATAGMVFVSFGGLTKVASVAEEVRRPGRNIPLGMFSAVIVITAVYVAAVFVTVGVLDEKTITTGVHLPLSRAAEEILGPWGGILLAAGAMLAFCTTANSGILSASRSPMAMGRDGLIPAAAQKVSRRFGTPYVSIVLTGVFMIVVIAALDLENLVKVASTMMLMLFVLVNVAVLIMRHSKIQNYRPLYTAPLYPWLQLAGIAVYLFLIVEMGRVPLLTTAVFILVGIVWYVLYVRRRIVRESAFVYMVKNIVSRKIYRSELEEELKQIALERDEVVHDRFDKLISACDILDLEGPVQAEYVFRRAAGALAKRLGTDEEQLFTLFQEREAQSSTVIDPGLAIPHIIVDGEGLFEVLLIRCKEGATFPDQSEPVRVVFVLAGSLDERNYHLRALMAIAHITHEHDFVTRWLAAPKPEHLRDLVLLSARKRDKGID